MLIFHLPPAKDQHVVPEVARRVVDPAVGHRRQPGPEPAGYLSNATLFSFILKPF